MFAPASRRDHRVGQQPRQRDRQRQRGRDKPRREPDRGQLADAQPAGPHGLLHGPRAPLVRQRVVGPGRRVAAPEARALVEALVDLGGKADRDLLVVEPVEAVVDQHEHAVGHLFADRPVGVVRTDPDRLEGQRLSDLAGKAGVPPEEYALLLLEKGDASLVSFNMSEDDIERIMRQPWTMTCTDGDLVPLGQGKPHPRAYGAFARKLKRYVRERGTLDLAAAIRTMTSMPASRILAIV